MKSTSAVVAGIFAASFLLGGEALATPFDLNLTVTGGTSDGVNGTPSSFSGTFDIPTFTGSGTESFTGAAQIQSFSITLNNVWDAGATTNQTDSFTTPFNDAAFSISFQDGVLTAFDFTSVQFDPLDFAISFPSGFANSADWDVFTDSDGLRALFGTLSVTPRGDGNEIPEPGTFGLVAIALSALFLARRRRALRSI